VDTSGTTRFPNYGLYAEVSNSNGTSYGLYGDIDNATPDCPAYGALLDVEKTVTTDDWGVHGIYVGAKHAGIGNVSGIMTTAYASDSGETYGGRFRGFSSSGDTGPLYGVYGYVDNDTSGPKYAGYFRKYGGGYYAGYFAGGVHVNGVLTGIDKQFVQPHKSDPSKEIVYVSLEGPEHAVFIRGNATLKDGKTVIEMPEEWQQVAAEEGITVNLTPLGGWAPLYAESVSKNKVVVRVAGGGDKEASFSYYIMAQRDGFQEHKPIQKNKHFTANGISAWQFENGYAEDTLTNRAISAMLKSNGILDADGKLNKNTASTLGWKVIADEEDPTYLEAHRLARAEDSPKELSPPQRPSHQEPQVD
jgi:hypothetical protein